MSYFCVANRLHFKPPCPVNSSIIIPSLSFFVLEKWVFVLHTLAWFEHIVLFY